MSTSSFAAAQARILERQEARRLDAQRARNASQHALQQSSLRRLPYPFNRAAGSLDALWTTLLESEGTRPALRVGQVDAELLDEELLVLLKGQVGDALKYFGAHLQDEHSSEILLALRAVLFKLTVWDNDASYGAALQGLRYADARKPLISASRPSALQKALHGLITVLGRYGFDKWSDYLIAQEGSYNEPSATIKTLSMLTTRLTTFHSIASFTSFLVFLVNGRYRTLTDRFLRLRLISPTAQTNREVSFEYLNRQLVWHAFTEFLLFLLPLVGISRWRRWLSRAWRDTKRALSASAQTEDTSFKEGPLAFLPERTCPICYQDQNPASTSETEIMAATASGGGGVIGSATTDVVNPYETVPCKCIYCFVCIATKLEAEEDGGWSCLRCGEPVQRCRPWDGDVVIEREKGFKKDNGKHVGFVVSEEPQEPSEPRTPPAQIIHEQGTDLGTSQWQLEDG